MAFPGPTSSETIDEHYSSYDDYHQHTEQSATDSSYDYYNDNAFYDSSQQQQHSSNIHHQQHDNVNTYMFWYERLLHWMEYCSRPPVPMALAVLVILLVHFQDPIRAWWSAYFGHASFRDSLTDLLWTGLDALRGWGHSLRELLRIVLLLENNDNTRSRDEEATNNRASSHARGRPARTHRQALPDLVADETAINEQRHYHASSSVLVSSTTTTQEQQQSSPLESTSRHEDDTTTTTTTHNTRSGVLPQQQQQQPLEPAFLSDHEYPPGWMVYHPALGVVSKERADEYEQAQQRQELQPASPEEDAPFENDTRIQQQTRSSTTSASSDLTTAMALPGSFMSSTTLSASSANVETSFTANTNATLAGPLTTTEKSPASSSNNSQTTTTSQNTTRSRRNRKKKKSSHSNNNSTPTNNLRPASVLPSTIAAN